jgi:tetratricopeptide (TPR) repeat protein
MHWQGASDDGLLLIEQASNVLLGWLDNKRKYVQGRTIYAMILAATKRHAEAASSLENTAQMARELGDVETLAHIVNNIGYCYYQTGEIQRARKCFETALELFTQLGLVADALRPRNYLATILINERKYGRAVSELYISRAAYLEAGLPNEAAYVMLKIIRALILAGRENSINWHEMFDIFGDVGLRHEALLSLSKLHELAMKRSLRAADIDAAEDVISRLSVDAVPAEDVG